MWPVDPHHLRVYRNGPPHEAAMAPGGHLGDCLGSELLAQIRQRGFWAPFMRSPKDAFADLRSTKLRRLPLIRKKCPLPPRIPSPGTENAEPCIGNATRGDDDRRDQCKLHCRLPSCLDLRRVHDAGPSITLKGLVAAQPQRSSCPFAFRISQVANSSSQMLNTSNFRPIISCINLRHKAT